MKFIVNNCTGYNSYLYIGRLVIISIFYINKLQITDYKHYIISYSSDILYSTTYKYSIYNIIVFLSYILLFLNQEFSIFKKYYNFLLSTILIFVGVA